MIGYWISRCYYKRQAWREKKQRGLEGYKRVKKTKEKIGGIKSCVVLPEPREIRGDRYRGKAKRNALNPQATEQSSGERK